MLHRSSNTHRVEDLQTFYIWIEFDFIMSKNQLKSGLKSTKNTVSEGEPKQNLHLHHHMCDAQDEPWQCTEQPQSESNHNFYLLAWMTDNA